MKIISAQLVADSITLELGGKEVNFRNPNDSLAVGIGTVTQERTLVPDFTVLENIYLSRRKAKKWWGIDWAETKVLAQQALDNIGCTVDINAKISEIAPGQAQMVEIARALVGDIKVLILDEPTSSLTSHEVATLFVALDKLRKQSVGIIFISHRMEEIFEICDHITVLRDGSLISSGTIAEYSRSSLIFDMIGREETTLKKFAVNKAFREVVLRAHEISVSRKFSKVSFSVTEGEIVGIIGLVGAGHSEVLESIFGMHSDISGSIHLNSVEIQVRNPRNALERGIAFVPGDRKLFGLVAGMSVLENSIMASTARRNRLFYPKPKSQREFVRDCVREFGIVAESLDMPVSSLSGGNQQKVLLTKWLGTDPQVLLLDEPTRGVDVGAKSEIYRILLHEKEKGLSILISSSEIPELLTLCDRILVMHRGKIVAELDRSEANESLIVHYAMGEATNERELNV